MVFASEELVQRLLTGVVEKRRSPNEMVSALLKAEPEVTPDELQLTLLETVLRLEKMYDEVCRDEWNDWQRVDYFLKATRQLSFDRSGSAGLLQMKSEFYRSIALIAADMIALRGGSDRPVANSELRAAWRERNSKYFG